MGNQVDCNVNGVVRTERKGLEMTTGRGEEGYNNWVLSTRCELGVYCE